MARKRSLGFATIKEAQAAVRAIVGTPSSPRYRLDEEFFHPLLQRLFIEQPYWCEPPGPVCTKFKWTHRVLPYGATTDWQFMAYSDEPGWKKKKSGLDAGWKSVSWRKAVGWYKFDIVKELKEVANHRISIFTAAHREAHRRCEHEGCTSFADHVHHCVMPRLEIVAEALASMSDEDFDKVREMYDWWSDAQFTLPDDHKFMQSVIARHGPGTLRSLCRKHHNDAHGHQTHVQRDPFEDV